MIDHDEILSHGFILVLQQLRAGYPQYLYSHAASVAFHIRTLWVTRAIRKTNPSCIGPAWNEHSLRQCLWHRLKHVKFRLDAPMRLWMRITTRAPRCILLAYGIGDRDR